MLIQHPFDQHFDLAAAVFFAEQASFYNACIVQNQQVMLAYQAVQLDELAIFSPVFSHLQQAAGTPLRRRMLCRSGTRAE